MMRHMMKRYSLVFGPTPSTLYYSEWGKCHSKCMGPTSIHTCDLENAYLSIIPVRRESASLPGLHSLHRRRCRPHDRPTATQNHLHHHTTAPLPPAAAFFSGSVPCPHCSRITCSLVSVMTAELHSLRVAFVFRACMISFSLSLVVPEKGDPIVASRLSGSADQHRARLANGNHRRSFHALRIESAHKELRKHLCRMRLVRYAPREGGGCIVPAHVCCAHCTCEQREVRHENPRSSSPLSPHPTSFPTPHTPLLTSHSPPH